MAINFNKSTCQSRTDETIFGIVDIPPSTLVFKDAENWNVWVENSNKKEITHTAIDDCLNIPQREGERCESMLTYDDTIVFIELKDRDGGRWAGKARDQIQNTIALFQREEDMSMYRRRYGHIANKQRPNFKSGGKSFSQKFEDETGFILRVSDVLKID